MKKWMGVSLAALFLIGFAAFPHGGNWLVGNTLLGGSTAAADANADAGLCKPTLQCAQQAVAAALAAKAIAEKMSSDFEKFTKAPPAQVGMMPCHKQFAVTPGLTSEVIFTSADCQNVHPVQGWTYTASLIGTDICGGFSEYEISPDPANPMITFHGNFRAGCTSSVTVHWLGFSPRAF